MEFYRIWSVLTHLSEALLHRRGPRASASSVSAKDDSWGVAALDARDAPALFTLAEQLEQFAAMKAAQACSCGTPCAHSPTYVPFPLPSEAQAR